MSIAGLRSKVMKNLITRLKKAATTNIPIFLEGETGTGKNYIAEAIHHLNGNSRPFVPIVCDGLPPALLESELFGYEKGAFTGAVQRKTGLVEEAHGGTLFLDEVENLNVEIQSKLLRLLDEKKFWRLGSAKERSADFRLIAAGNRSIAELVATGVFREDLYYRMVVMHFTIPPLRERREDILPLANSFLKQCQNGKKLKLSDRAADLLLDYPWPGNIRELKNVIAVAANDGTTAIIQPRHIAPLLRNALKNTSDRSLAAMEKEHISKVLRENNGNRTRTARILKITESTLRNKIRKHGIG